jgi:hypothetical protein
MIICNVLSMRMERLDDLFSLILFRHFFYTAVMVISCFSLAQFFLKVNTHFF